MTVTEITKIIEDAVRNKKSVVNLRDTEVSGFTLLNDKSLPNVHIRLLAAQDNRPTPSRSAGVRDWHDKEPHLPAVKDLSSWIQNNLYLAAEIADDNY